MEKHEELNSQQQQAVEHFEGPMLVLAGAGSGKTRIVTARIAHLLQRGIPASQILAVTFTNKAAGEMRHRIERLTAQTILASTFHSLGARLLRKAITALGYGHDFVIYDEEDSERVLKECLEELNLSNDKGFRKSASMVISQAKNECRSTIADKFLMQLFDLYQKKLKQYNAVDFDDLLYLSVTLLQQFPEWLSYFQKQWQFILIDEYQDTNVAQCRLIKLLADRHGNVFAVGDPDQSIYSWRGADIANILNFEEDFPGAIVVPLEQNYRSRNNILQAASALINHNHSRYRKKLWSARGEGSRIGFYLGYDEREESEFVITRLRYHHDHDNIPLRECAIFYRTHFQSRVLEDALLRKGLPYVIVGGISFYQRREVKDILAFLRFVQKGTDYHALARTINLPKRGWGESTLEKLRNYAQARHEDLFTCCLEIVSGNCKFKVNSKQRLGLQEYIDAVTALRDMVGSDQPIDLAVKEAIKLLRYDDYLNEDPPTAQERRENLQELISKASEWKHEVAHPSLTAFLEELSLKSSLDDKNYSSDSVRLMTLHHSKGLEFHTVFIVGLEEELLPHPSANDNKEELEEERRLCYVGMTRAKEQLYLTCCNERILWGRRRSMVESRFLGEIPKKYLKVYRSSMLINRDYDHEDRQDGKEDDEGDEGENRDESAYGKTEISGNFEPGDEVIHPIYGRGVVREVYNSGAGLAYEIFFPKKQIFHSFVGKVARLRPAR